MSLKFKKEMVLYYKTKKDVGQNPIFVEKEGEKYERTGGSKRHLQDL